MSKIREDMKMMKYEIPLRFKGCNNLILPSGIKYCNNPNFAVQERQCDGHVCRVLTKCSLNYGAVMVERDDGTVWEVNFENFDRVETL